MYDLIIIGGGPGGYITAIRAAQNGAKVALIEKDKLGGVCLNWGCIPTKSLLESAHLYRSMQKCADFGVEVDLGTLRPNLTKMVSRSRAIVDKLTYGIKYLMEKNGITVYAGHGRICESTDKQKVVSIDQKERVVGRNLVIATGARNRQPNGITVDGDRIWDCRHAMIADQIPESLIIIGAGAIGMEFASFFSSIGSKVTVIEYAPTILPFADQEIIRWATNAFKKKGIEFHLSTSVESVKNNGTNVQVKVGSGDLYSSHCLVATGVTPNTEDIGLDCVPKIRLDRGVIQTKNCATSEQGIYAIGDVTTGPWLAHKAMQEGLRCADMLFAGLESRDAEVPENTVPMCVYSSPQIAQIGLTEAEALKLGKQISVGTYHLSANGKAMTEGNDGIIKVILEKKTQIFVGAHMVGEHVTELISNYSILQYLEGLGEDMYRTTMPHPTLSESVQEAVLAAMGQPLHM